MLPNPAMPQDTVDCGPNRKPGGAVQVLAFGAHAVAILVGLLPFLPFLVYSSLRPNMLLDEWWFWLIVAMPVFAAALVVLATWRGKQQPGSAFHSGAGQLSAAYTNAALVGLVLTLDLFWYALCVVLPKLGTQTEGWGGVLFPNVLVCFLLLGRGVTGIGQMFRGTPVADSGIRGAIRGLSIDRPSGAAKLIGCLFFAFMIVGLETACLVTGPQTVPSTLLPGTAIFQ